MNVRDKKMERQACAGSEGGGAAPGQNILGWLWTDVIAENPPAEQTQGEPEEEVGEKWEGEREAKRVWQDRRERGAEREEEK